MKTTEELNRLQSGNRPGQFQTSGSNRLQTDLNQTYPGQSMVKTLNEARK